MKTLKNDPKVYVNLLWNLSKSVLANTHFTTDTDPVIDFSLLLRLKPTISDSLHGF